MFKCSPYRDILHIGKFVFLASLYMYGSYWHGLRRTCTKFVSFKVTFNIFHEAVQLYPLSFTKCLISEEFLISYHKMHVTNLDRLVIYFCFVCRLFYV